MPGPFLTLSDVWWYCRQLSRRIGNGEHANRERQVLQTAQQLWLCLSIPFKITIEDGGEILPANGYQAVIACEVGGSWKSWSQKVRVDSLGTYREESSSVQSETHRERVRTGCVVV